MKKLLLVCATAWATVVAVHAAQFTYSDSGGTVTQPQGTSLSITDATLASPAGTLSVSCPLTSITPQYPYYSEWSCVGGSFTFQSTDGSTAFSGSITSGTFGLQKKVSGNVTTYDYTLIANIAGSLTVNGQSKAVFGSAVEALAGLPSYLGTGTIQTGTIDLSQQYEPVYVADSGNNRIVQMSDIIGDNWTSLGQAGTGVKQFSQPWGIAVDATGRIYVSDRGNCRIARVDNMTGANWTSFGSCGSGTGQFSSPEAIAVNGLGTIYVADTGNNRIVQMSDITGAGFAALGGLGSGTGQFSSPSGVASDPAGKIYVADAGNLRIVRVDDISGTNWTTMSATTGHFYTPSAVLVDSASRIYVADSQYSFVVRSDDMTGANPAYLGLSAGELFLNPTGMFVDPDGAVYVADNGDNRLVRSLDMTGAEWTPFGTAGSGVGNFSGPAGVFVTPSSTPVAAATVTPASLAFPIEAVGLSSPAQSVVLSNIGTAPFGISNIASTGDFTPTDSCPGALQGGQTCTVSVVFAPKAPGARSGSLAFSLSGATAAPVALSGTGALVSVNPTFLFFVYPTLQQVVTVTNPGNKSVSVKRVAITGRFKQTNTCQGALAPGASCTITVNFVATAPGLYSGTLTVIDSSGTRQPVQLEGQVHNG